jgi:large subunit ribosomal protein L37Ae
LTQIFIKEVGFSADMARTKAVTRYGVRYGRTLRERLAKAESGYKGKQKCPHCLYEGVKRLAAGIWNCEKCDKKFTSRAYQIRKPLSVKPRKGGLDV